MQILVNCIFICKLSPSDQEMQKWRKTISVWIQIAIYHHQDQSRVVGFNTPLISFALFIPRFPCPVSAEQLWRFLSALPVPGSHSLCSPYQLVPGESCLRVHLDLRTSGGLKLLPYAGRALPGRSEKGLSCVCSTWSITNGIWDQFHGEGEQKNTVGMEKEHVLVSDAQQPALEQLLLRVEASILQSRSRLPVICKIYSPNLFTNAVKHFLLLQ